MSLCYIPKSKELDDAIESLKGTINSCDCIHCGAKDAMKYEGNVCFICSECKKPIHENIIYIKMTHPELLLDN